MRRLMVVLAAVVAVNVPAVPAWAHAKLLSSAPAAGAVLPTSPAEVTLRFSEEPNPSFTTIVVSDTTRTRIPTGPPAITSTTVTVALEAPVADGVYTVAYRVVSKDGHTVQGSYAFTVGASSSAPSPVAVAAASSRVVPPAVLVAFGGVAVALIGVAAYFALTTRRRDSSLP